MRTALVTGASGNLGSAVVAALLAGGHQVHAHMFSRGKAAMPGVRTFFGDIKSGEGLGEAMAGVDAIVHCASFFDADGTTDLEGTRQLIAAAKAHGKTHDAPHLIYISIVGVERIAFPYFKTKFAVEGIVRESGLPYTIQRATQFHNFVLRLIAGFEDEIAGTIALPQGLEFQSIAVAEVASALVAASAGSAAGRLPDIAGPQIHALEEMARLYADFSGKPRNVVAREVDPQPAFHDAFRQGRSLSRDRAVGRQTWEAFLRSQVTGP